MKTCNRGHEREDTLVKCQVCRAAAISKWKSEHPEEVKEHGRKHARSYRSIPENAVKISAYMEKWHEAHKEEQRAKSLANYYKRKLLGLVPVSTQAVRDWKKSNPFRAKELSDKYVAKRRAVKAGVDGSHSAAEWRAVTKKQQGRCAACAVKCKLTKDHIVPISMGGSDFIWNIAGLCQPCNSRKRDQIAVGTQLGLYDKIPAHLILSKA